MREEKKRRERIERRKSRIEIGAKMRKIMIGKTSDSKKRAKGS